MAARPLLALGLGLPWFGMDRGFFFRHFLYQSRNPVQREFICDAHRYPLVVSNLAIELNTLCAHRFTA